MAENRIKKNTLYNIIKTASTILFPLITFPYISRVLHAENVGKINFGNSIINYFSLIATMGITTYAIREASKKKNNKEELGEFSSRLFSISIVTTIISYVILALVLAFSAKLQPYKELILIQSASILFATLGADWLNTAMEDFRFITIRTVTFQILSIIAMLIFVRQPGDYIKYAMISVVASSGANIVNILYRRKYCRTVFTFDMDLRHNLLPILFFFGMMIEQVIYVNVDTTMLGLIRGDTEVGWYATATKIYNMVNQSVVSVEAVIIPQMSAAFSSRNTAEVNRLLRYESGIIALLGIPAIVGLNMVSDDVVILISGFEYLKAAPALRILTAALLFSFISGIIGNTLLIPSGKEKMCLAVGVIGPIINFLLNLIFIPKYGLYAAAVTTVIAELAGIMVGIRFVDKEVRLIGAKRIVLQPLLASIPIIPISLVGNLYINSPLPRLVVIVMGSIISYLIILLLIKNEPTIEFINAIRKKYKK